jgi:heme exporter protein CcmD
MTDFLDMGGYAQYVWGAFGISCVVLTATVWLTKRSLNQTLKHLRGRVVAQNNKREIPA